MITAAQFERSLYPALRVVVKDQEEMLAPEYPSLFNVSTTTQAYEDDWSWGGFGSPAIKKEGRSVQFGDLVTGYSKRYYQATYGLAFRVTLEMRMFEKYGIINQAAVDLGDSIREGIEVLSSGLLNTALTATGPDGKYLFATDHPLLRGGTQANRLSTLADLSVTSYQQACTIFETMKSAEGRRRRMTPSLLWFAPQLEYKAKQLLESSDNPETANRAKNVIRKTRPFMYHYLTSSTMWGLKATKDYTRVIFALKPSTTKGYDFQTDDYLVKCLFMIGTGYTDWRGWLLGNQ